MTAFVAYCRPYKNMNILRYDIYRSQVSEISLFRTAVTVRGKKYTNWQNNS